MTNLSHQTNIDPMNPADNKRTIDGFLIVNAQNKAKLKDAETKRDAMLAKANEVYKKYKDMGTEAEIPLLETAKAASELAIELGKITVENISDNPREWTKADLTKLGTEKFGVPVLDALAFLSMHAKETNGDNFTQRAKVSQQILAGYMPQKTGNVTKDLINFINTIDAVNAETWNHPVRVEMHKKSSSPQLNPKKTLQAGFKTGALFDADQGVKLNPLDDKTFDQQAALAVLDASGVKADKEHSLQAPLETLVTDAVKGIKNSVSLAA